jgi:hypothetical protein
MMHSMWGTIHDGKVEFAEPLDLPEGARVLLTVLPKDDDEFWLAASKDSLATIWDNDQDDIYAALLSE